MWPRVQTRNKQLFDHTDQKQAFLHLDWLPKFASRSGLCNSLLCQCACIVLGSRYMYLFIFSSPLVLYQCFFFVFFYSRCAIGQEYLQKSLLLYISKIFPVLCWLYNSFSTIVKLRIGSNLKRWTNQVPWHASQTADSYHTWCNLPWSYVETIPRPIVSKRPWISSQDRPWVLSLLTNIKSHSPK